LPLLQAPFNELDDAEIVQKEDFAAFLSSLNTEIFSEASELTKLECLQALTEKVKKLLPHAVANLHPGRTIVFLQYLWSCVSNSFMPVDSIAIFSGAFRGGATHRRAVCARFGEAGVGRPYRRGSAGNVHSLQV
jgi:hypothetical protein